jgi:microcystin-dependent protein
MAYEIKFSDFVNKGSITVENSSPNTETSLVLPGRNLSDYGKLVNENFLHLLENFANNNPPKNPVEGQLWYDTSVGVDQLKIYDGTKWLAAGGLRKSLTAPEIVDSISGDLWVNTLTQQLFLFTGTTWILVGPDFSSGNKSGSKFEILIDKDNQEQQVIINYINNVAMMVISNSEFVPKSAIPGFPIIYPGVNISSSRKYYGTASKAEGLIVSGETLPVSGDKFARKDKQNIFERPVRISNRDGLVIGETPTLSLTTRGSNTFLNTLTTGDFTIRINNNGVLVPIVSVRENRRVGINNIAPSEALDVTGNIKTSGTLTIHNTSNVETALAVNGNINTTGDLTVVGGLTLLDLATVDNIIPIEANTKNIGSSTARFNNIHATTVHADLFDGTARFASKSAIASSLGDAETDVLLTFNMTGHVTSPSVIKNGLANGSVVEFNTEISDLFFTKQPDLTTDRLEAITVDFDNDKLLVSRNEVLYVMKPQTLTGTIPVTASGPVIPIGSIMPYVGDTAPSGWLMCDGSYVNISTYSLLFDRIRNKYGAPQTGRFKLPDFRGKFMLGFSGMSGGVGISTPLASNNSVVNEAAAAVLGASGGQDRSFITEENLPDHFHGFTGDSGTQYYAVSNVSNATDSESEELIFVSGDPSSGLPLRGLKRTESIEPDIITGTRDIEEFSVVNPFATVNFIIYFGETQ